MQATTTRKAPVRPVHPGQPTELRELILQHNDYMREYNKMAREWGHVAANDLIGPDVHAAKALLREWYATAEGAAYRTAVRAYNRAAEAFNAYLKAEKQARRNHREVATVRAGACPRCTSTHAGEC